MTLYLIRHFKVLDEIPTWITAKEFNEWVDIYDQESLDPFDVSLPEKTDLILCSTLSRARRSIEMITSEEVFYLEALIEVDPKIPWKSSFKLPKYLWFILGRVLWYRNERKGENRVDSKKRAREVLNYIKKSQKNNIFILTHGFFLKVFEKELLAQGFKGKIEFKPKNGKIYTFMENEV